MEIEKESTNHICAVLRHDLGEERRRQSAKKLNLMRYINIEISNRYKKVKRSKRVSDILRRIGEEKNIKSQDKSKIERKVKREKKREEEE